MKEFDYKNTPIEQWPREDRIKTFIGGPLYAMDKMNVFDKIKEALKKWSDSLADSRNRLKQSQLEQRDFRNSPAGGYSPSDNPHHKLHRNGGKA